MSIISYEHIPLRFKHVHWKQKHPMYLESHLPGKVYRRDEDDATHSHQFMQLEGIMLRTVSL